MASVNKAILIGNIGRDPDVRYTQKGDVILNFSVATTEKYNDTEETQWHRVSVFGKLAAAVKDYVAKGRQVYIEGQIVYEDWIDKDGNKRNSTSIKVGFNGKLILLGKGDGKREQGSQEEAQERVRPAKGENKPASDDDIPF